MENDKNHLIQLFSDLSYEFYMINENSLNSEQLTIVRKLHLAEKVVFIDGQGGCGKTLFSSLLSSFDRAEKITYCYEIEQLCAIYHLKRTELDSVVTMIRMLTDLIVYDMMMSRNVNFRPGDLSSIFRHPDKFKYIKRFFQKSDMAVPERILTEKPILPLTVHNLFAIAGPIFQSLGERVVFIEIVRHPLYMIIQNALNYERVVSTARHFNIHYCYGEDQIPWFVLGWEKEFLNANPFEKAILSIDKMNTMIADAKRNIIPQHQGQILTIPFENFVMNPDSYMTDIEKLIGSKITKTTLRELKRQNVPRKKVADGIPLDIYKRCGWVPPKEGLTEKGEFDIRRRYVLENVSPEIMKILDRLCAAYEEIYMGGILIGENGYKD